MRIVVDTNIAFSAILNTNSRIARIFLQPKTPFNFYSTEQLLEEIEEHRSKLKRISKLTEADLTKSIFLITHKIRFIHPGLIPKEKYIYAESLTEDVDVDDTEFIALTEHMNGKFWSGDKSLRAGLQKKKWNKFITTDELFKIISP